MIEDKMKKYRICTYTRAFLNSYKTTQKGSASTLFKGTHGSTLLLKLISSFNTIIAYQYLKQYYFKL